MYVVTMSVNKYPGQIVGFGEFQIRDKRSYYSTDFCNIARYIKSY